MSEDVSQMLNKLVKTVAEVYRGYHQFMMSQTVFSGLLLGEPILLIGSHGTMKTSMANFIGNLFDKPVVVVETTVKNRGEIENFFEDLGKTLNVSPEDLMRNLVEAINVSYDQTGDTLKITVEIGLIQYPAAKTLGKTRRKPLSIFSQQVNNKTDPEEVLGYGIDHPAVLGMKPPHAIKAGKIAGADYVVLDEIFGAPMLLSKLHHALNEKVVDTTVGPIITKPLCWVLCTNPINKFYMTNYAVVNCATLDRYALSTRSLPPSSQEILAMQAKWKSLKTSTRVPIELIYSARKQLEQIKMPDELMIFCLSLASHLSKCYFAPSTGKRSEVARDPFETEKDCSLCIFHDLPCGLANVGKTRTIIRLQQAITAHALLEMKKEADEDDLIFALMSVLPHRLSWNSQDFLSEKGDIFTATKGLVEEYAEQFARHYQQIKEVEQLITNKNPELAKQLQTKYFDAPIVRSLLDELTDMLKESALKKGDKETVEKLDPKINLARAIQLLKGNNQTP